MKSTLILSLLCGLALGTVVSLSSNCPEQFITSSQNICIKPIYIEGCELYKNNDECASCSSNYKLLKGKCSNQGDTLVSRLVLVGCLTIDEGVCTNCANGFQLLEGLCKEGAMFCNAYDEQGACRHCEKEYSLIFGQCRHNQILGCKVEQEDHTCQECHKPFNLQNFICVVANCRSYNDYGCVACECGFFTTTTRACQKMQSGCMKYNRGVCTECLPHYKLNGGVCTIEGCLKFTEGLCSACQSEYNLVEGGCEFKDCLVWKDDTCQTCKSGFHLIKGQCVTAGKQFVCEG